jgi:hypothetical protein
MVEQSGLGWIRGLPPRLTHPRKKNAPIIERLTYRALGTVHNLSPLGPVHHLATSPILLGKWCYRCTCESRSYAVGIGRGSCFSGRGMVLQRSLKLPRTCYFPTAEGTIYTARVLVHAGLNRQIDNEGNPGE